MRHLLLALALALLTAAATAPAARAQPIFIDFELLPGMANSPGANIPVASRLSDQYLAAFGVRFSSGSPFVATVTHGAGTPSGTRLLGGSTPGGALTYSQAVPITVEFLDPSGTQPRVVSVASIRGDLFSIPGTKTLEAFDIHGLMIGSQTLQDSNTAPLMVAAAGIHSIRFYSSSATVGFDDLRFDTPMPLCAADFDGDGFVTGDDFDEYATDFIAGNIAADFNGDGFTNGDDFDAFVLAFEVGC